VFLDRYGVLDADYEQAVAAGRSLWVLRADRQPVPWAGRYLVIIDSQVAERPLWAPLPGARPTPATPATPATPGTPAKGAARGVSGAQASAC
nr:hypothetical protein [Burkholderiaceae bacterium]